MIPKVIGVIQGSIFFGMELKDVKSNGVHLISSKNIQHNAKKPIIKMSTIIAVVVISQTPIIKNI
jgi:hypothetical protein